MNDILGKSSKLIDRQSVITTTDTYVHKWENLPLAIIETKFKKTGEKTKTTFILVALEEYIKLRNKGGYKKYFIATPEEIEDIWQHGWDTYRIYPRIEQLYSNLESLINHEPPDLRNVYYLHSGRNLLSRFDETVVGVPMRLYMCHGKTWDFNKMEKYLSKHPWVIDTQNNYIPGNGKGLDVKVQLPDEVMTKLYTMCCNYNTKYSLNHCDAISTSLTYLPDEFDLLGIKQFLRKND